MPIVRKIGASIIAITGSPESRMAKGSGYRARIDDSARSVSSEPGSHLSTTATLVLGDAIAVTLMKLKKVSTADYARRHPGCQLGRRLLLEVRKVMRTEPRNPIGKINDTVSTSRSQHGGPDVREIPVVGKKKERLPASYPIRTFGECWSAVRPSSIS